MESIKHAELIKKYLGYAIQESKREESDKVQESVSDEMDEESEEDQNNTSSDNLIRSDWYNREYSINTSGDEKSWYESLDEISPTYPEHEVDVDKVPDSFLEYYNSRRELR